MAPNHRGWAPRLEAGQQRGGHLQTRPGSVPSRAVPSAEAGPQPLPSGRQGSRFRNPEAPEAPSAFAGLFEGRQAQPPLPHWTRPTFPFWAKPPLSGTLASEHQAAMGRSLGGAGKTAGRGREGDGRSPTAAAASAAAAGRALCDTLFGTQRGKHPPILSPPPPQGTHLRKGL